VIVYTFTISLQKHTPTVRYVAYTNVSIYSPIDYTIINTFRQF